MIHETLDVTGPDHWTRYVSDDGIAGTENTLTFVVPIDFLYMVRRGENLRAMPRDYYRRCQSGGASARSDPKGRNLQWNTKQSPD